MNNLPIPLRSYKCGWPVEWSQFKNTDISYLDLYQMLKRKVDEAMSVPGASPSKPKTSTWFVVSKYADVCIGWIG